MLHILTTVGQSAIHGMGVFAAENVMNGTLIWTFQDNFDRRYSEEEFMALHPSIHTFFKVYGYKDANDGYYYLTVDNDRFTNHAETPNIRCDADGNVYAACDIKIGEELTANYQEFIANWQEYLGLIKEDIYYECDKIKNYK